MKTWWTFYASVILIGVIVVFPFSRWAIGGGIQGLWVGGWDYAACVYYEKRSKRLCFVVYEKHRVLVGLVLWSWR
jgi:hypothetical protein